MLINKKILLVEDDIITAAVESAMLRKNGFEVITSSTGEKAVEIIRSQDIDLVLMDIDLGHGITGPETAEIMLKGYSIPIVFLTSHSEEEMVEKVSTITRYGYVSKNSGDFVLLSSIKMAFELREALKKLEDMNMELTILNTELNKTNHEIIKTNLKLMQYQNNLEMSEEKFRQLFENMTEGVAIHELYYDRNGNPADYRILSVNKSYEIHTCIPAYKASGMLASRLYETGYPPYIKEYAQVVKTGSPLTFDTYFDKMDKHFHIKVIRLGKPFFATIFEDITKRIKTEEALRKKDEQLRKALKGLKARNEELSATNNLLIEHEKELILSEERLRIFINSIPDIVCFKDGDGRWLEANEFSLDLFNLKNTEFKGKKDSELAFFSPQYREALLYSEHTDEIAWDAGRISRSDEIIPGKDSLPKIFDIIKVPVFSNDGNRRGLIVIGRDMTKRVETENTIRSLLHEKDILLREVHHRIKNNMDTISNLLFLQSETLADHSAVTALNDARNRIQSMMIIYDKLYRSSDYKNISIKNYLANLIEEIFSVFPLSEKIRIEKFLEDFIINSNTLFHIGIIVNEIITNSFKYAFPDERMGIIKIRAEKIDKNMAQISISDNGIGFNNPGMIHKKGGFGISLIGLLAEQMNASVELNGYNGMSFRIRFMVH